jgi:hypothetical protein
MGRDRLRTLARAWPVGVMLIAPWVALQAPFVRHAIVDLADRMHRGELVALLQYVIGYCLGALILMPKALLSGLAGYAYGPVKGLCVALPSATLGACCAFGIGRLIAKTAYGRMFTETARFRLVDTVVRTDGLRIAILLRLAPVMPQPLLSVLLGAGAAGHQPGRGALAAQHRRGGGRADGDGGGALPHRADGEALARPGHRAGAYSGTRRSTARTVTRRPSGTTSDSIGR